MGKLPQFSLLMMPPWFSAITTSWPLFFVFHYMEISVDNQSHSPSWRRSLEYIDWCGKPFSPVGNHQALMSRWKGQIFELAFIIIGVLSETKIPKTFTRRDYSPRLNVTIAKRKYGWKSNYVYISIEICVCLSYIPLVLFYTSKGWIPWIWIFYHMHFHVWQLIITLKFSSNHIWLTHIFSILWHSSPFFICILWCNYLDFPSKKFSPNILYCIAHYLESWK